MAKTLSLEEIEHVPWREIMDDAKASGEVIVTDESGQKVVVVPMERYAELTRDDRLADIWADVDRDLAVLREPGTEEKLNEIFALSPQQIADAANRAARRRKG